MTSINELLRQALRQHAENCVELGSKEFDSKAEVPDAIEAFIDNNIDDLEDRVVEFVIERFVG